MRVGIIGGTGPAGRALALRLADNGTQVVVGSRSVERAKEIVDGMQIDWPGRVGLLEAGSNEDASSCDIVVLATPWEAAVSTVVPLGQLLEGQVLVSMVNALALVGKEFQPIIPARGSVAATVQHALPKTLVTAAFQHLPAGDLGSLDVQIRADVLVCADDRVAAEKTIALVDSIAGLHGLHCGSLASANAVEALTPALLNVNRRYKMHAALSINKLATNETNPE